MMGGLAGGAAWWGFLKVKESPSGATVSWVDTTKDKDKVSKLVPVFGMVTAESFN